MNRHANFKIVSSTRDWLVIRDVGPWDQYMTVTNAAEQVVEDLIVGKVLHSGQRIAYYDSGGDLDEIVVAGDRFESFRLLTNTERAAITEGVSHDAHLREA